MTGDSIQIRGARQNNLKGVDVDVPRGQLVAITGVSGSGKSSLAFDTLFREGQRRFLETLSAYARQFLGRMEKPDVDRVDGLSPAIAVDQKAVPRGPRSTVGTLTEIHDHLRVLFARAGTARCPEHGTPLRAQTPESIVRAVLEAFAGQNVHLLAPLVRDRKGQHRALLETQARRGIVRVRVNGKVLRIEEVPELERYKRHRIEAVVDRMRIQESHLGRLREGVVQAMELGEGDLIVLGEGGETAYSSHRTCPACGTLAPPLEPRLFSFNSPHGACTRCDGLGLLRAPSESTVVADPSLSIRDGALAVTRSSGGALLFPKVDFRFLESVGEAFGFDLDTPFRDLSTKARRVVLYGSGDERFEDEATWNGKRYRGSVRWQRRYKGVLPALEEALAKGGKNKALDRFLATRACPDCGGSRLNRFARAVTVGDATLGELLALPIADFGRRMERLELSSREAQIAAPLSQEIRRRTEFLLGVGLGYLTMDRSADSLSGGEAQRIRLAAQLGAGLQGVLYVLDEPSIGLHPRDHGRLLEALRALRDQGNTVIVVEHDESTLLAADHIIDVGPGAGRHGGQIVAVGSPRAVARADSPTGRMLRGELKVPAPSARRRGSGDSLWVRGARGFHLKGIDVRFPLGTLCAVSGVSGSGKSTLVERTLVRALERHLGREGPEPAPFDRLEGVERVEDLVVVDAAPIGRTPRSNPATYTGAFGPIRELFASLPEARLRGWDPGRFSFNVEGGRCEACQGAGAKLIELQFLSPVTVPCEECGGHRFQAQTLDVRFKGLDIAQVLNLTVEAALEVFGDLPRIAQGLRALSDVGVGYLTLGQPSTTLSGGEAQRVKLAKYLQKNPRAHTLFVLDEPTTGLHGEDVAKLVGALQTLVERGHTVLVIEHHLDVLRAADFLIDLGPEGGAGGGELLAMGTPEEVMESPRSATGKALREVRKWAESNETLIPVRAPAPAPDAIRVYDARTHNLRGVHVCIPRDKLTVVTGPSGSGKSSLALDTIYTAGRQRFVESLSTYARQFLASRDRPPVERIEGLGPAVAVEARTSVGHPRSTVATTTELHDHLRVLWARAGTRHCPEHGEKLERRDASALAKRIQADFAGAKGWLLAPWSGRPAELPAALEAWRQAGFARVLVDGVETKLADMDSSASDKRLELVIDRLDFGSVSKARLAEAIEQAESLADGRVCVLERGGSERRADYSTRGACVQCGFHLKEDLEPRHFSFNTHVGACPTCDGLGMAWRCDPELLLEDPARPLWAPPGEPTAIGGKLGRYLTKGKGFYEQLLRTVAKAHRIPIQKPFASLSEPHRALLLHGVGARAEYQVEVERSGDSFELTENFSSGWPGLCGHVDRWHQKSEDPEWRGILERVMARTVCATCKGERIAPAPRAVTVGKLRLPEVLALSVGAAHQWLSGLKLPHAIAKAVDAVLLELRSRLELLVRVGLDYLTLDRSVATLSGGEARRVRLSAALGSQLVGVVYVLDEPTVGLHPRDIDRLSGALEELARRGNTVLVVEHDETLMRRADHLIDMGPGAGRRGGLVVASGTPAEVERCDSPTGRTLRGEHRLVRPEVPSRAAPGERIGVQGATLHNLKDVGMEVAYGELTGVCGPSGSGKSTLVLDTLVPALMGEAPRGRWKKVIGGRPGGRRVVVVDASPLGRSPLSIPATAVGLMEPLRELFARLPEARMRGFTHSAFSFNSPRGRCPACEGKGQVQVEMQFLADLWLECEDCRGTRYRPEVLDVRYRGRSVADVLGMCAEEALEVFEGLHEPTRVLNTLCEVGLGYLPLGQSSTTLSGGEAQRVKLATELLRTAAGGETLLVLDEPSTGLHASDVVHLYGALRRLVARGDAVVVIEHHTGLLSACDQLVELGPAGGAAGGRVVAMGTPAELAQRTDSPTGPWLAENRSPSPPTAKSRTRRKPLPRS